MHILEYRINRDIYTLYGKFAVMLWQMNEMLTIGYFCYSMILVFIVNVHVRVLHNIGGSLNLKCIEIYIIQTIIKNN